MPQRPDETTRLLPKGRQPKNFTKQRRLWPWVFTGLIVLVLLIQIVAVVKYLYPDTHDRDPIHERLRWEWDLEKKTHLADQVQMEEERKVMADQRQKWDFQRKTHLADQKRINQERMDMTHQRHEWDVEKATMAREESEARQKRDLERQGWDEEKRQWEDTMARKKNEARQKRDLQREEWDKEKRQWLEKVAEQEQKEIKWREEEEELEHRRDVLRWGEVRPVNRCSSYGVREYTATLINRPMNYDGRLSCAANPIEINGVTYDTPDYCEDVVSSSLIFRERCS